MLAGYRYKSRLEKLIGQWTEYHSMVLHRLGSSEVSPGEERRFLGLKGQIAEGLASLTSTLGTTAAQDAHAHLRAMNNLLNRYPSLYADAQLSGEARADFEREWHDHFLFFNKLKGMPPESPAAQARPAGFMGVPAQETIHRRTGGARFATVLLRLLVVVALVWAVVRFVPWYRLTRGSTPDAEPGSLKAYVYQAWDAVKLTAANLNGGFLDPVVRRYGPEVTTVLVAALLLAVGYWIFIRMK
jgi:hypothetical protein